MIFKALKSTYVKSFLKFLVQKLREGENSFEEFSRTWKDEQGG